MGFIDIETEEVGNSGLVWLFLSYGYVLYFASNLIAEGSDLLLLVPSMAGLVGGVVLPLLGAVPDGAIVLFSGLGPIETAQETLSVGVGALAGSTIMLLTIPWGLGVLKARVDYDENGYPNYFGKPKLTPNQSIKKTLTWTGVAITEEVKKGGIVMMITSIPYFLIQGPAMFIHGPLEKVADGEHWWSLAALLVCVFMFFWYLWLQLQVSRTGSDRLKRVNVMKKLLQEGEVSLTGALGATLESEEKHHRATSSGSGGGTYQAVQDTAGMPPEAYSYLKDVLADSFKRYDKSGDGYLDKKEVRMFFHDFHDGPDEEAFDELFKRIDLDGDDKISFHEFIAACYEIIKAHKAKSTPPEQYKPHSDLAKSIFDNEQEEQEEIPEEFSDLSPEEQQTAIKRRAFFMLFLGTALVLLFSDPMVDVLQELGNRLGISPFYVSFVLAPIASNASEFLASQYYFAKKTRKTTAVAMTALEGAGSTNNSFSLAIFMGLIYFRSLAWAYTAETIAILVVEYMVGCLVQRSTQSAGIGVLILSLFPLSIALVAIMESFGID